MVASGGGPRPGGGPGWRTRGGGVADPGGGPGVAEWRVPGGGPGVAEWRVPGWRPVSRPRRRPANPGGALLISPRAGLMGVVKGLAELPELFPEVTGFEHLEG